MLIEYINKAMSKAVYDKLEDGSFSGKIPQCPGVVAFGKTLYQKGVNLLPMTYHLFYWRKNAC